MPLERRRPPHRRRRSSRPHGVAPYQGFVTFATLVLAGFLVWASFEVLMPVVLAFLLTFVLTPLADRLRKSIGHVPAVLASVGLAVAILFGLGWAVESQFVDVLDHLDSYSAKIKTKVDHFRHSGGLLTEITKKTESAAALLSPTTGPATQSTTQSADAGKTPLGGALRPGAPTLPNVTKDTPLPVRLYPEESTFSSYVSTHLTSGLSVLATAFIILVFVIFMLLGRDDLRDRLIRLASGGERLDVTTQAIDDAAHRVSKYLVAQVTVNTIYGASLAACLWAIGFFFHSVDNAGFPSVWLLGLIAGVFRFVPYLGPILGAILPLTIALGTFDNNSAVLAVAGTFVVLEIIVSQFVEPLLYGDKTGMSPIAVLVAAAFWTWLWGPIGLLVSTPLTVVLVVAGRYIPQLHFLHVLLGDEPALPPDARLYQRLSMLDRDEADRVAEGYAAEKGLEPLYDNVLLPAIAAAERNLRRGTLHRSRYGYIRKQIDEIAEELAIDHALAAASDESGGDAGSAAKKVEASPGRAELADEKARAEGVASAADAGKPAGPAPRPPTRVLCVATGGRADEAAARMLKAILESRGVAGVEVRSLRRDAVPIEDALARVGDPNEGPGDGPGIVVLSALPPSAISRARAACRRVREAVPPERAIVGLWASARDVSDATRRRVRCDASTPVVYTLATAADAVVAAIRRADEEHPA